jgi:hypothetical protein
MTKALTITVGAFSYACIASKPCFALYAHPVYLVRQEPGERRPLAGDHLELGAATLGATRAGSFFRCAAVALFHLYGVFVFPFGTHVKLGLIKEGIVVDVFFIEELIARCSIFNCLLFSQVVFSFFKTKFILWA